MMTRKLVSLLVLSIFWVSCADYNSSTSDDLEYVEITANDADPNFAKAFEIIKKRCANCHNGNHREWNSYNSNDKWITKSGVVIKNSVATSDLIIKTSQNGTGNMPPAQDLSAEEYNFLKTWINGMP